MRLRFKPDPLLKAINDALPPELIFIILNLRRTLRHRYNLRPRNKEHGRYTRID